MLTVRVLVTTTASPSADTDSVCSSAPERSARARRNAGSTRTACTAVGGAVKRVCSENGVGTASL